MLCLHGHSQAQTARGCTTHFLRLCRPSESDCREPAAFSLCGLETDRDPHTVLCKRALHVACAPVRPRLGCGAAHGNRRDCAPSTGSRRARPSNRHGSRESGPPCSYAFNDAGAKAFPRMMRRCIPFVSSEAQGALTPLRSPLSNVWRSHAVSRCHRS